jgi:hypothetical protein
MRLESVRFARSDHAILHSFGKSQLRIQQGQASCACFEHKVPNALL